MTESTVDRRGLIDVAETDPGPRPSARPSVGGKFLTVGGEKFLVRGVAYGTFRENAEGDSFPSPEVMARD